MKINNILFSALCVGTIAGGIAIGSNFQKDQPLTQREIECSKTQMGYCDDNVAPPKPVVQDKHTYVTTDVNGYTYEIHRLNINCANRFEDNLYNCSFGVIKTDLLGNKSSVVLKDKFCTRTADTVGCNSIRYFETTFGRQMFGLEG